MKRPSPDVLRSRLVYLLGVVTYLLQGGMHRLPTGSDFLSVIRGHDGVSLRAFVKRSSEVHRRALLSEGTGIFFVPSYRVGINR